LALAALALVVFGAYDSYPVIIKWVFELFQAKMAEAENKPFAAGRPMRKGKQANCKKCKQPCALGELRIGKVVPSPFGEGLMKQWHHVNCMWEVFAKQRATTRRIEDPEADIEGWDDLSDEDKKVRSCGIYIGRSVAQKGGIQ